MKYKYEIFFCFFLFFGKKWQFFFLFFAKNQYTKKMTTILAQHLHHHQRAFRLVNHSTLFHVHISVLFCQLKTKDKGRFNTVPLSRCDYCQLPYVDALCNGDHKPSFPFDTFNELLLFTNFLSRSVQLCLLFQQRPFICLYKTNRFKT